MYSIKFVHDSSEIGVTFILLLFFADMKLVLAV